MAATGRLAQHWDTTSRAKHSHWPHWVATPSSNWMSSKSMPAWAWRAISRSETRRQTQTIMAVRRGPVMDGTGRIINANRSYLQYPLLIWVNRARIPGRMSIAPSDCRGGRNPGVRSAKSPIRTPEMVGQDASWRRPSATADSSAGRLWPARQSGSPDSRCAPRCPPGCFRGARAKHSPARIRNGQCLP
jgi:hypothetical protein